MTKAVVLDSVTGGVSDIRDVAAVKGLELDGSGECWEVGEFDCIVESKVICTE